MMTRGWMTTEFPIPAQGLEIFHHQVAISLLSVGKNRGNDVRVARQLSELKRIPAARPSIDECLTSLQGKPHVAGAGWQTI